VNQYGRANNPYEGDNGEDANVLKRPENQYPVDTSDGVLIGQNEMGLIDDIEKSLLGA